LSGPGAWPPRRLRRLMGAHRAIVGPWPRRDIPGERVFDRLERGLADYAIRRAERSLEGLGGKHLR
jgi:hypothetical protein